MSRTRSVGAWVIALFVASALATWPRAVEAYDSSVTAERHGVFRLFRGAHDEEIIDVDGYRCLYIDGPPYTGNEAHYTRDGEWHPLFVRNDERLVELWSYDPGVTFRLTQKAPLYANASTADPYRTGRVAPPGDYIVRHKVYNFVELQLPDGQVGWIYCPENLGGDTTPPCGHFLNLKNTIDARVPEGLVVRTQWIKPEARLNVPMIPEYVTVHNASNFAPFANAAWHAQSIGMNDSAPSVSYHYVVDEVQAIELIPLNDVTFNAGDRYLAGNGASIAIEICDYANGAHYHDAEANGAKLAAALLYQYGLTPDRVRFHRDWNGKECPYTMIRQEHGSVGVDGFMALVAKHYDALVARFGEPRRTVVNGSPVVKADAANKPQPEHKASSTPSPSSEKTPPSGMKAPVQDADYGVVPLVSGLLFVVVAVVGTMYGRIRRRLNAPSLSNHRRR